MAQMMEKIKEILSNQDKTPGEIESESETYVVYSAYGGTTTNVPEAFYPGSRPVAPRETHYQKPYSGALGQQQHEYNLVKPVDGTPGPVSSDPDTGAAPSKDDGKGELPEDTRELANPSKTSERSIGDDVLNASGPGSIGDDVLNASGPRSIGDDVLNASGPGSIGDVPNASGPGSIGDVPKPSDGSVETPTPSPTGWDENSEAVEKPAVDSPDNDTTPIARDEELNTTSRDSPIDEESNDTPAGDTAPLLEDEEPNAVNTA